MTGILGSMAMQSESSWLRGHRKPRCSAISDKLDDLKIEFRASLR